MDANKSMLRPEPPKKEPKRLTRLFLPHATNDRHGKMGILDRIRQATTVDQVEKLLLESQKISPSAKTQKKILRAARAVINTLCSGTITHPGTVTIPTSIPTPVPQPPIMESQVPANKERKKGTRKLK